MKRKLSSVFFIVGLLAVLLSVGCSTTKTATDVDKQRVLENRLDLAMGYLTRGDHERTRFHLNKAMEVDSSSPAVHDAWALLYQQEKEFEEAGFRMVPNCVVRNGSFIGKGAVIMPNSFINIGGYCGERSMVDTAARIGSAARLGADCHLSAGAGLGGILEPVGSRPTIIEDSCFIGALSEIVEGVIVRKGSVVSMGCYIGKSTKIINRNTGEITSGEVPAGSVVVPGSLPSKKPGGPNLYCVVIIKTVDEQTRSKTSLNDLLRD